MKIVIWIFLLFCTKSYASLISQNDTVCGRSLNARKASTALVKGADARLWEHPWTALILKGPNVFQRNKVWCGGAIVSKRHILTAAHCVTDISSGQQFTKKTIQDEFEVVLGVENLLTAKDGRYQRLKVESAVVHEKYAYADGQRGYYDIAVLTLNSDIEYEPLITQPICLPYKAITQENFWDNKTGVITGYAHQDKAATYLGNTQMTTLPITRCNQIIAEEMKRIKECKSKKRKMCDRFNILAKQEKNFNRTFDQTIVCAKNEFTNDGTCPGDSGGPFIMKEGQDRYILVGTLHGSFMECSNHWPTIYSRIDNYSILKFVRKAVFNETIPPLNADCAKKDYDDSLKFKLINATKKNDTTLLETLIASCGNVNTKVATGIYPLYWPSINGRLIDFEIVQILIDHGADVNAFDDDQSTPILLASQFGHLNIVEKLIDHGANVNDSDKDGDTSLILSSKYGHNKIVEKLIDANADVNAKNNQGSTALELASKNGHGSIVEMLLDHHADLDATNKLGLCPLIQAASKGHVDIVEKLINHGANVNNYGKDGDTSLIEASEHGHELVVDILLDHGADVNASDKFGESPLLQAASEGHFDIVKKLIDHDADLDATDIDGETALIVATIKKYDNISGLLVDHGADVNKANKKGDTALLIAAYFGPPEIVIKLVKNGADVMAMDNVGHTALILAAKTGDENVTKFLIENGANVNAQNIYGDNSITLAALNGYDEIMIQLIENGANVNAANKDGNTALMYASRNGKNEIVSLLIENGANINFSSNDGFTAIFDAVIKGHEKIVKELIEHGADVNLRAKQGQTLLYFGERYTHQEIVKILKEHGAT